MMTSAVLKFAYSLSVVIDGSSNGIPRGSYIAFVKQMPL